MPEQSDADSEVVRRQWKYAPPPWRMFDALTDELGHWLDLRNEDGVPEVERAVRPALVVYRPWVDGWIDRVEVEIDSDGVEGSLLRVAATAKEPVLSDEDRRQSRYRLGKVFGSALRRWVDQPHW
jgi:hypothetical protein